MGGLGFSVKLVAVRGSRFPSTAPAQLHPCSYTHTRTAILYAYAHAVFKSYVQKLQEPSAPSPPHPLPSTTHARNTGACPSDASNCQLRFFRQRDLESLLRGASGSDSQPGVAACDRLRAWKCRCHASLVVTRQARLSVRAPWIITRAEPLLASPYSRPRVKEKQTLS